MSKRKDLYLDGIFLLCALAYVVGQTAMGRFVEMDEVFFKAAGREWAASGRFAAPEIDGYPNWDGTEFMTLDPPLNDIWFAQPPGYTFLFGLFTRLAGFGPRQCMLFDALIHAGLAFLTYRTARALDDSLPEWLCFLTGVAVLPLGTLGRPDELATCLGMAGLLLLFGQPLTLGRSCLVGILFGLSAATTVGAAIMLGMIACILVALEPQPWPRKNRFFIVIGVAAAATVTAAVAPILSSHPQALRQYVSHAGWHLSSGTFLDRTLRAWQFGKPYLAFTGACLVMALVSIGRDRLGWPLWIKLWLGPIAGIVLVAIFLPGKFFYLWFVGPWMLAGSVLTVHRLGPRWGPVQQRVIPLTLMIGYALAAVPFLKNLLVMLTLPANQSLAHNAAVIRDLIPPGSTVLTDDYWWVLGDDCRVRDPYFSHPRPEELDYILLGGDGSGDANSVRAFPPYLADHVREHFVVVSDTINREPLHVLGKPLPGSAQGYGVLVLGRKKKS